MMSWGAKHSVVAQKTPNVVVALWRIRDEIIAGGRGSREEDDEEEGDTAADFDIEAPGVEARETSG